MDNALDYYRFAVSALAVVAAAVNLSMAWIATHQVPLPNRPVMAGYGCVASATCGVALYWRLTDHRVNVPLNPGDFTGLVPIVGFLVVGVVALRQFGHRAGIDGAEGLANG